MKLRALSVSEVNSYLKRLISTNPILSNIIVEGEISNFKLHTSGHAYFTMKDEESKISCVMFHRDFSTVLFKPEDGLKVRAKGRISVYERDGKYQLYVSSLESDGQGDLYVQFEKLKKKLSEEGLFDQKHKKNLPSFPNKIAVITSPTGAAVRDILNVTGRRSKNTDILIVPVRVQGVESKFEIVRAIEMVNAMPNIDLIILSRGGGSIEELWSFNEEMVADSIFKSRIPIISAVGHETDYTIADFVSDMRAPTPSSGAEIAVQSNSEYLQLLDSYKTSITKSMMNGISYKRSQMDQLDVDQLKRKLFDNIDRKNMDLDRVYDQLIKAVKKVMDTSSHQLREIGAKLDGLSPLKTLTRGFTISFDENKKVIRSIKGVKEEINVQFIDGKVKCKVLEKTEECLENGGKKENIQI